MKQYVDWVAGPVFALAGIPTAFAAGKGGQELRRSGFPPRALSWWSGRPAPCCISRRSTKLEPASVTKVMTMLLVAEAIDGDRFPWMTR